MSFTIQDLRNYAENHDGKCLTETYTRCDKMCEWKCSEGHVWKTSWSNVKRNGGKWCQTCRYTQLKDLQTFAQEKNGKCLSKTYKNISTNYIWECENNHTWKATWLNVKYNRTWCKACRLWDLSKFEKLAQMKGGKCLKRISGNGIEGRYIWQCENNHQWEAKGNNIVHNKTWCPDCKKLTLEEMQNLAEERGGKCLSDTYVNKRTNLTWQCDQGHIWEAFPGAVKNNGTWCLDCKINDQKLTIEYARELAISRSGECLSTKYINDATHMKWKCEIGHIWKTTINNIQKGSWCRKCHLRKIKAKALEKIITYVCDIGGKLLTHDENLFNCDLGLMELSGTWQCNKDHTWTMTFEKISAGRWCPECRYKSETICRKFFEEYMSYNFPKKRLKCMDRLELDGYCDEVKLAFEYNGLQHYQFVPFFHRNGISDLEKQNERDERKQRLCQENNIQLITIPPKFSYQRPKELRRFIYDSLLDTKFLIEINV